MNYNGRIEKVREFLDRKKISSCIIIGNPNIFYLTGFLEIDGVLVIDMKNIFFFVPSLYQQECIDKVKFDGKIQICNLKEMRKILLNLKKISFINSEVTIQTLNFWKKKIPVDFIPVDDFIKEFRAKKEGEEIKLIQKAFNIAKKVMDKIKFQIKEGVSELDIVGEIQWLIRKFGGRKESFPVIVSSGINSSYPHHKPENKKIKKGEVVLVDLGVDFSGYKSDITKTFFIGKIPENFKFIYKKIKETIKICEENIKEGINASILYKMAVTNFKKENLDKYFIHGLGHGIGIEVHEKPVLNLKSKDILSKSNIFTLEPGIYIPNVGGIRLEKMFFLV